MTGAGIRVAMAQPQRQTLMSGAFDALLAISGQEAATGWPEPAVGACYAVRLRRDRILVVNGPELRDGWHAAAGVAVSDVSGGLAVLDVTGPNALDLLRRGTEISPDVPSRSVSRLLFGLDVHAYRHGAGAGTIRLHVEAPFVEALWSRLHWEIRDAEAFPGPLATDRSEAGTPAGGSERPWHVAVANEGQGRADRSERRKRAGGSVA
jgi:hypothetical protein